MDIWGESGLYKETVPLLLFEAHNICADTHTHDCIPGLSTRVSALLSRVLWVRARGLD